MLSSATPSCSARWSRGTRLQVRCGGARAAVQVVVQRQPSEEVLKAKGVRSWPTWGCGVSTFPWTYQESETCYLLEGAVVVTPKGGEPVEIKAGDMATFPEGMSCTWDVKSAISKHYQFH
ncbi:hypothetical protein TSOC_004269 [Tetrabaena socialis]|uniref:(S)-ureidoglycine aminohydrolase cupin domain-containing protein n=1 Tax=Tetrabaena socialis TaxID=47790 RepID=A0A2J8A9I3_9CHLO|nr:hypothetical protein TSOC_004269 [Tetrabaena socialis]|eukprot:PNH09143.1 hypothetical protein TSOC_004269 [Tetrabaena socialis]